MQLSFQQITSNNGLAQNTVDCILKDSRGFMWFGTWNGLCRFDGYSFNTFQKQQTNLLPGNRIQSLCEDSDGNIWVGTESGIALFNYKQFQFVPINDILKNVAITHITTDDAGNIWVATTGNGVWRVDKNEEGKYHATATFSHETAFLNINNIWVSNSDIWVASDNGVFVYSREHLLLNSSFLYLRERMGDVSVQKVFQDSRQNIWFGCTLAGAYKFNLHTNKLNYYPATPNSNRGLSHNSVRDITEDIEGNLIIGTLGGLNYYQYDSNRFYTLPENQSLSTPFINSLLADNDGNVWVGSDKGGVEHYNIYQKPFHALQHNPKVENTIAHNTVNAICAEKDRLWVGTAGGGLNQVHRNKVYRYQHNEKAQSLSNNFVSAIHRDKKNNLWVGTWGAGLNRLISNESDKFERLSHDVSNPNSLGYDFISCIESLNDDHILIGTGLGVDIYSTSKKTFTHLIDQTEMDLTLHVGCMLVDSKGKVWVGTENGLYRFEKSELEELPYNTERLQYDLFRKHSYTKTSLPGNYIISLFEDSKGNVWIGTYGNGICKYITGNNGGHFDNYTEEDGLCNNMVYGMEEDLHGNLWLSTDNGLSCFTPETKRVQNYYKNDGLLSNQFYWQASDSNDNGTLYFGSVSGLNFFNPDEIKSHVQTHQPSFTNFSVFGKTVAVGESLNGKVILKQPIYDCSEIHLSYKDAIFSIEFSALDYFLPEKIEYAYKMEGVDHDWVTVPSSRRFASYTNLEGGEYTFKVKASNNDGEWSEEPIELQIIITPPFWETIWFRILLILLLTSLVFLYSKQRTQRLHKQKAELEDEVHERTVQIQKQNTALEEQNQQILNQRDELIELNAEVKRIDRIRLRFFTNISHEFRTPLTLIISPLEQLMEKCQDNTEMLQSLQVIDRNAQRLLHLINQLLYFRKIETGNLKVTVREGEILPFIEQIFESFTELASYQQIHFEFEHDSEPEGTWFDAEKVENIIYNLLSNAFKFTPVYGSIKLTVAFVENNENPVGAPHVRIQVIDNGQGIQESNLIHIFNRFYQGNESDSSYTNSGIGLSLTSEMVKAMHGEISVDSVWGEGSCFTVLLPHTKASFCEDEINTNRKPSEINIGDRVKVLANHILLELSKDKVEIGIHASDVAPEDAKPTVLIVEDNHDLRSFLRQSLLSNYQVLEAENGKRALEIARESELDLIVSDVMMPELDGIEMCFALKKGIATSHIPVILLTAKDMVENIIEGLEAGADDYIAKPFNFLILQVKMRNLIESRRKIKQMFSSPKSVLPQEISNNKLDEEFIAQAYRVLDTHLNEPNFSTEHFAQEMLISRSLLYKKIKSLTELSITDFINTYKLKKAAELMKDNSLSIADVAFQSGFNDPKYFSRIFKKFYKMSPSEYQKIYFGNE
ncbi:MAG: two-component regulator propeller domain-containing protein [Mangrovibacterium sp.]